jgi:hypothetical protein
MIAAVVLTLSAALCPQTSKEKEPSGETVTLPDLGIHYTPPGGMLDKTPSDARDARERANSYTTKAVQLLLDLSSEVGDDSPEWHQIWIFHFPRAQLANMSEWMAEAKVNAALAGSRAVPASQPKSAVFDGHSFLVSEFEQSEPPITKHARIFTTVCKSQLISFVLVSNSAEQITAMEDSLKSLSFSGK